MISILFVLKSFIKKRLMTKSSDAIWDLFSGHTSKPYNNTGMHFDLIKWCITSSDATLPTLPNIALAAR